MRVSVLFLVAAIAASAQSPNTTPKATIEGQVVNAATGEPVRKAQVTLRGGNARGRIPYAASADPSGHFVFESVEPGTYRIFAGRTGFVTGEYGQRDANRAGTAVTLTAGQSLKSVAIKLVPQAVVTGRVVDEDGDPVSGVTVAILRYTYGRGPKQLSSVDDASTDDRGEYRFYALPPGRYYVRATRRGPGIPATPANAKSEGETSYVPVYFPNALDPSGAVAIDASAGKVVTGIDLALTRARTVTVSGRVLDHTGAPAGRGTRIALIARDSSGPVVGGGWGSGAALDSSGRFAIRGVRPGSYLLAADRFDDEQRLTARAPVDVGTTPVDNLAVQLAPGIQVKGRVEVEGAEKVDLSPVRVALQSPYETRRRGSDGVVAADGSFALANAAPGAYTVNVTSVPDNLYVKAIRLGNQDVLAQGLSLHAGGDALAVVLSAGAAQVDGTVNDANGQPAAGVTVVAVPNGRRRDHAFFYKVSATDDTGHFSMTGIAPGEYKLFAWEDVEPGAWQDPDFLQPLESAARTLTVTENGHETVQLKSLPGRRT